GECIEDDGIEGLPFGEKKMATVGDAADHAFRQSEILARQKKGMRVDVDDRQLAAALGEHRGKCAAAASDHQHIFAAGLAEQAVEAVNIGDEAGSAAVRLALKVVTLAV